MSIENMNSAIKKILTKKNAHTTFTRNGKLIVQVSKKEALEDLENQDIIPRHLDTGMPVKVVQSPKIEYKGPKSRPLIGGISCANSVFGGATLGGLVRDTTDGRIVGLTNNHVGGVLFDINYDWPVYGNTALSHILMLQPSTVDGGSSVDNIGAPKRAVATKFGGIAENIIDATIIELDINMARTDIKSFGQGPFSFVVDRTEYIPGTTVYKMGRTSGLTVGEIIATDANVLVTNSDGDTALYSNQIMIESPTLWGSSGDSGSLVLMKSQGIWKIIGLYFAGSVDDLQGFANHIGDVSTLLQVESWDGNVVIDGEFEFINVAGRCYQYKGTTLSGLSHSKRGNYLTCAACKVDNYPQQKISLGS
jgi:hypothetical protein